MSIKLPAKTSTKTATGYDKSALEREQRRMAQPSEKKVWKGAAESPIAGVLARNPNFRVMIVDDNRPVRHLVRSILLAFGVAHVDEADDGGDAIRRLLKETPDLVITDLEMAPMNGLEFTRQVRQNPQSPNPNLPIIVMTSYTEKERILEISRVGLTEVMAKPVTPKLLSRNITTAMENYERTLREREELARANQAPQGVAGTTAEQEDTDYFAI